MWNLFNIIEYWNSDIMGINVYNGIRCFNKNQRIVSFYRGKKMVNKIDDEEKNYVCLENEWTS